MKRTVFTPFLFTAILVLTVGLACGFDFGAKTQEPPPPPPAIIQPTSAPPQPLVEQPSPIPPTESPPTPIPPPPSPFFKEEFLADVLGDWTNFIKKDDPKSSDSKAKYAIENGKLVFTIEDNYLYSYLVYDKQSYKDVRLEVSADNRGKNNNNVSLICRYSDDGWYEFNIANNGMYNIYAYDSKGIVHKGYNQIKSGGSNAIRMGRDTNVYVAVCSGKILTLYINGVETASVTDNKFVFPDGKVGISVSSFNVYPIIVEFEYFDIQEP